MVALRSGIACCICLPVWLSGTWPVVAPMDSVCPRAFRWRIHHPFSRGVSLPRARLTHRVALVGAVAVVDTAGAFPLHCQASRSIAAPSTLTGPATEARVAGGILFVVMAGEAVPVEAYLLETGATCVFKRLLWHTITAATEGDLASQ